MDDVTEFNLRGTIAILITSTISNLAVFVVFLCIISQNHSSLHTVVTRLVLNLFLSDFIQSIGFMLSYNWAIKGIIEPGIYCDIQGFLINLGDVASGFWAFVICVHTYMRVVHSYEYPHIVFLSMITIWPFNILISALGFAIQLGTDGKRFYGSAGGSWCWIDKYYQEYRIGFHYGIILFNAAAMSVIYTIMFVILYKRQTMATRGSKRVLQRVNKKLVWYPAVYIVLVFPLALQRIVGLAFQNSNIWSSFYLIPAASIFTSAGLANAIIYSITRNLVSVKPVISMVPKIRRSITTASSPTTYFINTRNSFFTSESITTDMEPMSITSATKSMRISYIEHSTIYECDDDSRYSSAVTPPSPIHSTDPLNNHNRNYYNSSDTISPV
ncbi:12620_t:CDS:2 [Funneliformis caledonium]|uniref:12620_t:CDS:1 n=1 Tax=Funneliformis caledonium TaxID=1117310 RepID=A0A9N9ELL0_9GLOM|nr:12620_t:CDS:2 [Funneliformis caledonium]